MTPRDELAVKLSDVLASRPEGPSWWVMARAIIIRGAGDADSGEAARPMKTTRIAYEHMMLCEARRTVPERRWWVVLIPCGQRDTTKESP